MIDFDVITGPSPSEKPREPAIKPAPSPARAKVVAPTLPRATLLPRPSTRLRGETTSEPANPLLGHRD
jgi:hypothetical protein